MNPREFEEEVKKLEAGELSAEDTERLRETAAADKDAAAYLENVLNALETASAAFSSTADPGEEFTGRVMDAVRFDKHGPFKMQGNEIGKRIRRTRYIIDALIVITLIAGIALLSLGLRAWRQAAERNENIIPEMKILGRIVPLGAGGVVESSGRSSIPSEPEPLELPRALEEGDRIATQNAQIELAVYADEELSEVYTVTLDIGTEVTFASRTRLRLEGGRMILYRTPDLRTGPECIVETPVGKVVVLTGAAVVLELSRGDGGSFTLEMVTLDGTTLFETPGGTIRRVKTNCGVRATFGLVEELEDLNLSERLEWYDRLQKRKPETR